ncbi:MAG: PQQ-binding-like beta-propeller repeat protein, partial [Arenimonas sp.]|nr:PQQ-binding-like beta-propeller repeat protein [Arenimonas sp.]
MWHASINGRGDFVVASDPQVLANALKAALSAIVGRIGSSSNISANSVSVGSDTLVYQASYFSGQWTGELKAFPVSGTTVSTTSSWVASEQLPAYGVRNIFTRNVATSTGSTFPTVAQEAFLTTGIANYIKGDRSNEIAAKGIYRNRVNVLGDIINSSPAYVKDNKTVFVGANDGMLHAFDGTTGVEKFAYVPGIVNLTDLKSTADTNYDHRYLVDGPIVVS